MLRSEERVVRILSVKHNMTDRVKSADSVSADVSPLSSHWNIKRGVLASLLHQAADLERLSTRSAARFLFLSLLSSPLFLLSLTVLSETFQGHIQLPILHPTAQSRAGSRQVVLFHLATIISVYMETHKTRALIQQFKLKDAFKDLLYFYKQLSI